MKKIKINLKKTIKGWKRLSKKKKIITSAFAVIMVGVITVSLIFARDTKQNQSSKIIVQDVTVTTGNISNTIVGTGNLEIDASNNITVPSGITIKKVKVESGDAVSKGDTLATVDITSVLSAIETVQEEIESLDEEINECKDSDETETITAKISGTVKKIYAEKGDSVTDCIAENGALLVIAVDGDSDEQLEITASGGTISKIHVSKKESVSEGDTLLTITKDDESTEYKQLIAKRKALTESLQNLTSLAKTGKIVADIDGIVGDVNVSEGSESSSTSIGSGNSASQISYKTSDVTAATLTAKSVVSISENITSDTSGAAMHLLSDTSVSAENTNETTAADTEKIKLQIIGSGNSTKSNLVIAVPKTGNVPQSTIDVTDGSYEGSITWNTSDTTFMAAITYSADITLNSMSGYSFGIDSITSIEAGIISGTTISEDGKTLTFHVTFPATEAENCQSESTKNIENAVEQQTETNSKVSVDNNASTRETEKGSSNVSQNKNAGTVTQSEDSSQSGSYLTSTSASVSSSYDTTDEESSSESETYANDVTAFTLASNDNMVISVSVDELDINSVAIGQEASITLDAIEDETFTGTVTKVGNSASSSSSGVAKYTVKIQIPKDEQMKTGMNASATIVVENKENILTIPVNALQERGNKVFVYTEKDSEGNLSGETEVTTGLSDGDNVEITEGLSEGDIVYYQKTGNTSGQSVDNVKGGMFGESDQGRAGDGQEMQRGNKGEFGGMPEGQPGQ